MQSSAVADAAAAGPSYGHPSTGVQHGPARSSRIGRRFTGVFVRRSGQAARPGAQGRGQDPARRPWSRRVIAVCPGDRPRHPGLRSATNTTSISTGDTPTTASLRPRGLDRCRATRALDVAACRFMNISLIESERIFSTDPVRQLRKYRLVLRDKRSGLKTATKRHREVGLDLLE